LKAGDDDGAEVLQRVKESHIQDLCGREWFTRLWIVQEVTLAKEAVLYRGSQYMGWERFVSAMTYLQAASNTA